MKIILNKRILLLILVLLVLFIINIFWSTGFFRAIENKFEGKILKKVNLTGAEDITINKIDSFAIISSTARKSFPKTEQETGGLYFLDLKNKNSSPSILQEILKNHLHPTEFQFLKKIV